jgi:ArsR family transcriptional regulator, arsenate/arsenite/antimonite-responsive transcriptional repressor
MPIEVDQSATPIPRVTASAVFELSFALYAIHRSYQGSRAWVETEWLQRIERERPDIRARVASFWRDTDDVEWTELILVAHRLGMLFDVDAQPFVDCLERALAEPTEVPEMETELPETVEIIRGHLDELRSSNERRRAYAQLMADIWSFLKPAWEEGKMSEARAFAREFEKKLAVDPDIRNHVTPGHLITRETFAGVIDGALERDELVVVPLALSGVGAALFSFPGIVLIGVGTSTDNRMAQKREEIERAAATFKLFSDPTRLMILTMLTFAPASVTDLAQLFDLSQPTISVHVKMLREAGLLESQKSGNQTLYIVRRTRLREALEGALTRVLA